MAQRADGRRCVFCEGTGLTREHGWPEWLDAFLPERGPIKQWIVPDTGEAARRGARKRPSGDEVRRVCGDCNHHWMNDLENEAKPVVRPMVSGRGTFLDELEQRIVARWIFLRVLMLTLATSGHQVPDADYKHLYEHREPPPHATVLASVYGGFEHVTFFHMQPFAVSREGDAEADPPNSYLVTIAVGHFVGQVFGTSATDEIVFEPSGSLTASVRRLRPFESAFIWPPGPFLDTGALAMVAGTDNPTT